MKKISILIPTLNSIQFMKECIESVLNQTLQEIEIIVIDAGSTDGTVELIEQYQRNDCRIQLKHSEQRSYGYQLNMGIDLAKGEYIGVVESDDIIDSDMYRVLYETAKREDVDYVKSGFLNYAMTTSGQEMMLPQNNILGSIKGKNVKPSKYKSLYLDDFYLWSGIYKKKFLVDNQIAFNQSAGAAYQDIGFLLQVFTRSQSAVYLDECFYKYRRNNANSSTYSKKAFSYLAGEYGYIFDTILSNKSIDEELLTYFYYKLFMQCCSRFRLLAYHSGDLKEVEKEVIYLKNVLKAAYEKGQIDISVWDTRYQMEFFMFMESIDTYADYYRMQISAQKHYLQNMIKQLKNCTEIVLVSNSRILPFVYCLLEYHGIKSDIRICDNNPMKWGSHTMGLEIVSVEEACKEFTKKAYIIANPGAKKELAVQLNSYGVKDNQIFIYDLGCDWLFLS